MMKDFQIKVCGIKEQENYNAISSNVNMIGFNFYKSSKRYIRENSIVKKGNTMHVGVFVNASLNEIHAAAENYLLDYIQCHGGESADFCRKVSKQHKVIKVFSVSKKEDLSATKNFDFCNYFLFDTKTKDFGGSGQKFDWQILDAYKGEVPFLLAGGLGPEDVERLKEIKHPQFAGIDINSKFEIEPGIKDTNMIKEFIHKLHLEK